MLTLNDRRSELWQWDTGRKLTVDADCSQVHFSNKVFGRSIDVDVVDGIVDIPDTLLQTDKELTAWAFVGTAENGYTKISKVFKVNKRNKPADYVFTEPDQTTLGEILGRIEDLENRPSGDVSKEDIQDAVNEYLDNNPVSVDEKDPTVPDWAKQPQKPTYTAAEVGALPDTTKIPSTAEDVGALPANAFIPKTAADVGAIPVPETATVGQTIVVKSVDENGKPTEWEAVDMPGGGDVSDEGVVLLAETDALTENSTSIGITGLNLTEKNYVFRITGSQDKIGNGLDVVINGNAFWNYTGPGKDVFVGFGLVNSEWILKVYTNPILDRSHRHVVTKFSGVLNSVELKPHYASDICYINSGSKLMIYSGLFDAVLLAE